MLASHMSAIETKLLADAGVQKNTGHSLHKGTPREVFIRDFLEGHLAADVAIGTGEIIDANSKPGQSRNQFDIVIYKRNFPRLDFGGGITGFLAEGVVATIEVKSTLDAAGIEQAARAAARVKSLTKNVHRVMTSGYIPPAIVSVVVAYDGPSNMETIHGWIGTAYKRLGISDPVASTGAAPAAAAIDGVYVLGRGMMNFINGPHALVDPTVLANNQNLVWSVTPTERGSVLALFLLLTTITSNLSSEWINPIAYLKGVNFKDVAYGPRCG